MSLRNTKISGTEARNSFSIYYFTSKVKYIIVNKMLNNLFQKILKKLLTLHKKYGILKSQKREKQKTKGKSLKNPKRRRFQ